MIEYPLNSRVPKTFPGTMIRSRHVEIIGKDRVAGFEGIKERF